MVTLAVKLSYSTVRDMDSSRDVAAVDDSSAMLGF